MCVSFAHLTCICMGYMLWDFCTPCLVVVSLAEILGVVSCNSLGQTDGIHIGIQGGYLLIYIALGAHRSFAARYGVRQG